MITSNGGDDHPGGVALVGHGGGSGRGARRQPLAQHALARQPVPAAGAAIGRGCATCSESHAVMECARK